MNKHFVLLLLLIPFISFSQKTYVPDDNFENHLEANGMGDGIALNDSVLTSNINAVNALYVMSKNISDLTGIEDFITLSTLFCYSNAISELDISNNTQLLTFLAANNLLSCIKVWDATPFTNSTITVNIDPGVSLYVDNHPPINTTECDAYDWNGMTYTSSGIYTYSTTNADGCDSTATLNLTINNSTTSTDNVGTHCDSYTWVDGITYTTSNNSATWTTTNAAGCENVATLDLTITNSTSSTDTHIACDEFMWNCDGNTYTSSNNTATYTYINAAGCDSVVTLDLTINNSTSNSTSATACDSYTWIDGNTYTTSGIYTDVSTNASGCDHTETLELTINSVIAAINQLGDTLSAVTTPIGLNANWYNIQSEDNTTRIWLMEENTSSFSPTFDCSYFIVVSDENGCIDTSETYYYGANASRIGSFITSPNPTSGLINVKFDNSKNQFVMLELISSNGSKLDEFITVDNNLNIDLSKYPSGTYYLYFNSEDAVQGCALEKRQKISTKIILNK